MKLPVFNLTFSLDPLRLSAGWQHPAFLLLFWCCLLSATYAQEKQWDKTFGGSDEDVFSAMIPTPDGGYLLGGSSNSGIGGDKSEAPRGICITYRCNSDYWVVKIDAQGNKQWERTFGGGNEVYESSWGRDILTALCLTPDGGFLLGGTSNSFVSGDKSESKIDRMETTDYWIVKLDGNGNKLWDKAFGGNSQFRGTRSGLASIIATSDGGFLLGGSSSTGIGHDKTEASWGKGDYWVVKIDANGNKQWDKTIGGSDQDELKVIRQTPDGGYLLGGTSASPISDDKTQARWGACIQVILCPTDYWIVKLDAGGNKVWDKTIGGTGYDDLSALEPTADGGYLLGGSSSSGISGDKTSESRGGTDLWDPDYWSASDYWVVKLDANGRQQWDKTFGGTAIDRLYGLRQASDGGYLLAGTSTSGVGGDKTEPLLGACSSYENCPTDYWIVKTDSSGNQIWNKTLGGNKNDNLNALLAMADGSYLLGGTSDSDSSSDKTQAPKGKQDYWVIKIKDLGKKEQVITFDVILNKQVGDAPFPLMASSNTGLPVTFSIVSGPATLNGSIITLTDSGSVTVKASQAGNETYLEAHLTRTFIVDHASNAGRIWQKTLGGEFNEELQALAATADGGYLLAGSSASGQGGDKSEANNGTCGPPCPADYWVVKLDGVGNKQWEKVYGGNDQDRLQALVATPDGGYLLGGTSNSEPGGDKSETSRGNSDFWVVKIDQEGKKLWDKTFGGTYWDQLYDMVASPEGGYLLGGASGSGIGGDKSGGLKGRPDFWVVKIDERGNKQWDKTFGGIEFAGIGSSSLHAIITTRDGGYLLAGSSDSDKAADKSEESKGNFDYWVVKIDGLGNKQWDKTFGGNAWDQLDALAATPDGGYLLGGSSGSEISGDKTEAPVGGAYSQDYWLIKIDSHGNKLWDKTLGGIQEEQLRALVPTSDGGFLVGGNSSSGIGGDKTAAYRGEIFSEQDFDYWLVKLDGTGEIQWDKTLGGSRSDVLTALVAAGENSFLLGGYSASGLGGDKNEVSRGATDYWVVKIKETAAPPCVASGSILWEYWPDIHGIRVVDIPQDSTPTSTRLLPLFEGPSNIGEEYASRIRGYVCAPQTGSYTFWIAGDNETQLWLSPDANPAHKVLIAGHPTWTQPGSWFESPSQQSAPVALVAGQRYYIEALHKEGTIDDHLAVAWQLPDGTMEGPIPGSRLSPYEPDAGSRLVNMPFEKEPAGGQKAGLQVFPNPFSLTTTIAFTPEADGEARLELLSLHGRLVQTVFQGKVKARTSAQYQVTSSQLASGVYIARLVLNGKTFYRRILLLR